MGELIAVFKIMPESPDTDLESIEKRVKDAVPDGVTFEGSETQPVAFGLKALMVTVRMEDSEDISVDDLEEEISNIGGVESVSVTDVGRI